MLEGNTKGAILVVTYERWHTTTYIGVVEHGKFQKEMIRLTVLVILILSSLISFGCQCVNSPGLNFLNQVKNFDLVGLGTFHVNEQTGKLTFELEKIYKGKTDTMTIELIPGGIDCGHSFFFKDGQKLILGLNVSDYEQHPNAFVGRGCVTSSLFVVNEKVSTSERIQALPALREQRIGFLSRRVKLKRIENRIKRRS